MAQLTVNATLPGLQRGQPVGDTDIGGIVCRFNARSETRTVTVTYSAAQTHSLTIAGTAHGGGPQQTVTIGPITGDTNDATTAQAILAAIQASAVANSIVSSSRSSNVITLVARRAGPLTVTGSATGAAATTVATTVSEEQLEAGVVVVKDTAADERIRKPFTPTAKVITITVTAATNAKVYSFVIFFPRTGLSIPIDYTADGSATTAEISAGLTARVVAVAAQHITGADTTDELTLTAVAPGEDFDVVEADSQLTVAVTTANVRPDPDGVTLWPKVEDNQQQLTGNNVWPARFDVSIMRKGIIGVYVDQAVVPGDPVFYRVTANGANTVLGAVRKDSDTNTALALPGASFISSASAGGVAKLAINMP